MASTGTTIQTEIDRLKKAKADIKTAIINKGGIISDTATIDTYASAIDGISVGEANFGGFVNPGDSFENLDKKKFYLCTKKGQYANGFYLNKYYMAILDYSEDENKWLLKKERTCPVKTRNIVNRAISLNDARPGDTYFFKGQVWVKYRCITTDRGGVIATSQYLLTNGEMWDDVYCYTVPKDTNFYVERGTLVETLNSIATILKTKIYPKIRKVDYRETHNTDSPYVKITHNNIERTHPIHLTEIPFRPRADNEVGYTYVPSNICASRQHTKFRKTYGIRIPLEKNIGIGADGRRLSPSARRSIYTLRRAKLYYNRTALRRGLKPTSLNSYKYVKEKIKHYKWGKKSTILEKWRFFKIKPTYNPSSTMAVCIGRIRC